MSDVIKPRMNELSKQKETLQKQLNELKFQRKQQKIDMATVKKFLNRTFSLLEKQPEQARKVCQAYVKQIVVPANKARIKLALRLPEENSVARRGVGDGSRTHTDLSTRPSTVRVCLFRHPDIM